MVGQSAGKLDWENRAHQLIVSEHQSSRVKSYWTDEIWMDCQKIKIKTWIENKTKVLRIAEQNTKGELQNLDSMFDYILK